VRRGEIVTVAAPGDYGKGSGQNNSTIWNADPSRLAALLVG